MQVTYGHCSLVGPVRQNNEDHCFFWQPEPRSEREALGAIAVLADGVGGQGHGEVASQLAVDEAIRTFCDSDVSAPINKVIAEVFDAANIAVYNAGMEPQHRSAGTGRMATTLAVCVFRHNRLVIGHVGDCRVYILRDGRVERLTNDHSYVGVQIKLGLITVDEARTSELRSILTRSVGQEPFIRADVHTVPLKQGDRIVQCTDGVHAFVTEEEIYVMASKHDPQEACNDLAHLVAARGGDDNCTVQVLHVQSVDDVWYYRGAPVQYSKKEVKQDMANELSVGDVLDNRFVLDDMIARSGMATIFKATDRKENRTVAIKVPLMQFESDPGFFTRFEREEQIGARMNHPYILRVYAVPDKSRPYLVMEYLDGQTLGNLMKSIRPMPENDATRIVSRICEALIYLHDHQIVHRDLKPDNIMLCNDGSIRIMDFGIAKSGEGRRLTFGSFQPAMGTPDYMAPEQVKGKRGDARTDIYSLGAILYELTTGNSPFSGDNPLVIMNARLTGDPIAPRKVNSAITPQLEEVILKAMSRESSDRYSSAADFKYDLDHLDEVKVTGRADRLVSSSDVRAKVRSMRYVWVGILLPLVVVASVFALMQIFKPQSQNNTANPSTTPAMQDSRGGGR